MLWLLWMMACGGSQSQVPSAPIDGWTVARDHLRTDAHNCFANMLPYCETSEAFIDPILQETLDRAFDGEMPDTELRAVRVARRARATYANEQHRTEEARAALLKRVQAYYEAPATHTEGGLISVEMGVIPGHWEKMGRSGFTLLAGQKMSGQDWTVSEAVRVIREQLSAHPNAPVVAARVRLPQLGGVGGYRSQTWTYSKATRRIELTDPSRPSDSWFTDPIADWDAFAEVANTLDRTGLQFCGAQRDDIRCPQ